MMLSNEDAKMYLPPAPSQVAQVRERVVRANLGHRTRSYSVERSQFCSRRPLTRENSFSLSVTIT
jgi:hypothetical protein